MPTKRSRSSKPTATQRAVTPDDTVEGERLPRVEHAYNHLKQAIQMHRLKPGDRLREAELAEAIGVSRTPLREALARLESDGMIVNDSTRGLVVTELDYNMVSELYYIREVLEGTAARLAAQHASDVEMTIIEEICEQYRRSLGDADALAAKNRQFHEALYRCAHNRYLLRTLTALHDTLALLGGTMLADPARAEQTLREHEAITQAIKQRDPDAAEAATRAHIRHAQLERMKRRFAA